VVVDSSSGSELAPKDMEDVEEEDGMKKVDRWIRSIESPDSISILEAHGKKRLRIDEEDDDNDDLCHLDYKYMKTRLMDMQEYEMREKNWADSFSPDEEELQKLEVSRAFLLLRIMKMEFDKNGKITENVCEVKDESSPPQITYVELSDENADDASLDAIFQEYEDYCQKENR
jgi:hypothetical protein